MSYIAGTRPGPNCGAMSPTTKAIRPPVGMPEKTRRRARRLLKRGKTVAEIALAVGYPEEVVRVAVAPVRTSNPSRTRATLNVTLNAADFVHKERLPDEPVWEATDRLLTELAMLRAKVLVLEARVGPYPTP